jgi:hypothetical protein
MHSELKPLPDEISEICKRSSHVKFWRSSGIESQLEEVKGKLENAVNAFRVRTSTVPSDSTAQSEHASR